MYYLQTICSDVCVCHISFKELPDPIVNYPAPHTGVIKRAHIEANAHLALPEAQASTNGIFTTQQVQFPQGLPVTVTQEKAVVRASCAPIF